MRNLVALRARLKAGTGRVKHPAARLAPLPLGLAAGPGAREGAGG